MGGADATDGGIDGPDYPAPQTRRRGVFRAPKIGFQVKKQDCRLGFLAEMRPGGALSPLSLNLAEKSGAYIMLVPAPISRTRC